MERIFELVELAMKISDETEHDVFVVISGHVKQVNVHGYIGGHEENKDLDFYHSFYWDEDFAEEYAEIKQLVLGLLEGDNND